MRLSQLHLAIPLCFLFFLSAGIAVTPSLPSSLLFETERFQRVCSINK